MYLAVMRLSESAGTIILVYPDREAFLNDPALSSIIEYSSFTGGLLPQEAIARAIDMALYLRIDKIFRDYSDPQEREEALTRERERQGEEFQAYFNGALELLRTVHQD